MFRPYKVNSTLVNNEKFYFPMKFAWLILGLCTLPSFLNLLGFNFSSNYEPLQLNELAQWGISQEFITDDLYYVLQGGITHILLDWVSVIIAAAMMVFAMIHYTLTKEMISPIIGLAMLCSGAIDAFHGFANARLIDTVVESSSLAPFSWALSRVFNVLILVLGAALCVVLNKSEVTSNKIEITFFGIFFSIITLYIIMLCTNASTLPETIFPNNSITRPYDLIPIPLLILAIPVFALLYKKRPSNLTASLLIMIIPSLILQCHMAFGSVQLYDNHFNIAHALKILAYSVPLVGLTFDYIKTYKRSIILNDELNHKSIILEEKNKELDSFAYIASHDLKEPMRGIASYVEFLKEDYHDKLDEEGRSYINTIEKLATRMDVMLSSLLRFSRLSKDEMALTSCDLNDVIHDSLTLLQSRIDEGDIKIKIPNVLPSVSGDKDMLVEIFNNLISNGIKYNDSERKIITIGITENQNKDGSYQTIFIRDNGIGIKEKHLSRVFDIFKRLHGKNKYGGGSGAGLTITKKLVEKHGGKIWIESSVGQGSCFYFDLQKPIEESNNVS